MKCVSLQSTYLPPFAIILHKENFQKEITIAFICKISFSDSLFTIALNHTFPHSTYMLEYKLNYETILKIVLVLPFLIAHAVRCKTA